MRDRLKSLKKFRFTKSSEHERSTQDPLLVSSTSPDISMDLGPGVESIEHTAIVDAFLQKVSGIQHSITEMKQELEQVRLNHSTMLTQPCAERHQKLNEETLKDIRKLALQIHSALRELERELGSPEGTTRRNTVTTSRIKRSQFNAVSKQFQNVIGEYHCLMEEYRTKSEEKVKRQLILANDTFTEEQVEEILSDPDTQIVTHKALMSEPQLKEALGEIQTRNNELLSLQNTMLELQEMVLVLAALVDEQGEAVNCIENHIETAGDHIRSGMRHAQAFNMYASRNRRVRLYSRLEICLMY